MVTELYLVDRLHRIIEDGKLVVREALLAAKRENTADAEFPAFFYFFVPTLAQAVRASEIFGVTQSRSYF